MKAQKLAASQKSSWRKIAISLIDPWGRLFSDHSDSYSVMRINRSCRGTSETCLRPRATRTRPTWPRAARRRNGQPAGRLRPAGRPGAVQRRDHARRGRGAARGGPARPRSRIGVAERRAGRGPAHQGRHSPRDLGHRPAGHRPVRGQPGRQERHRGPRRAVRVQPRRPDDHAGAGRGLDPVARPDPVPRPQAGLTSESFKTAAGGAASVRVMNLQLSLIELVVADMAASAGVLPPPRPRHPGRPPTPQPHVEHRARGRPAGSPGTPSRRDPARSTPAGPARHGAAPGRSVAFRLRQPGRGRRGLRARWPAAGYDGPPGARGTRSGAMRYADRRTTPTGHRSTCSPCSLPANRAS